MRLVEAAHRLLDQQPVGNDGVCVHCDRAPKNIGHAFDCPWLSAHERIEAALEAAEALVTSYDPAKVPLVGGPPKALTVYTDSPGWQALVVALRGEGQTT